MAVKKTSAKAVVTEQAAKPAKTTKATAVKVEKAPVAEKKEKNLKVAAPVATKKVEKPISTTKVTFTLPKEAVENAETVALLGDFNNWEKGVSLKKQKDGSFSTAVELEKGRSYEYRFLINGEKWENAWNAETYKPTPFGVFNSVVTA
jgi:1,4-alpha-glucan branching enzyme